MTKVTTQLAGGTEADIMQINWPWLPLFSKDGNGFADLNTFKDIIDLTQWSDNELASTTVDGKLQRLPLSITGRVPWFNATGWGWLANKLVLDSTGPAISAFFDHPKIIEVYGDALEMFAYGEMTAEETAVEIHDGMAEILEDLKK